MNGEEETLSDWIWLCLNLKPLSIYPNRLLRDRVYLDYTSIPLSDSLSTRPTRFNDLEASSDPATSNSLRANLLSSSVMSSIDWIELLSSNTRIQHYTQQLEGLGGEREEALATWFISLQLVSYLRQQSKESITGQERTIEEERAEQEKGKEERLPERGIANDQSISWSTIRDDLIHLVRTLFPNPPVRGDVRSRN